MSKKKGKSTSMSFETEKIREDLEILALEVVTLEEDDIPAMGQVLNTVSSLEADCEGTGDSAFLLLTRAIKGYLERMVLGEAKEIGPVEEGIRGLQSIYRVLSHGEKMKQDISPLLEMLGQTDERSEAHGDKAALKREDHKPAAEEMGSDLGQELMEEDRQILSDFVAESLENLAAVEASLIHLEENPDDLETINAIFRPFHTIKGLSLYLKLDKINRLSDVSETLLDKARSGEIRIDEKIIDTTLEAVDMLTKMILGVKDSLENEGPPDNGVDIMPLVERIEALNLRSENIGDKPLGEILVQKGVVEPDTVKHLLEEQRQEPEKRLGEICVEKGATGSKEVISALRDQKKFGRKGIDLQVKVDTKKLDMLVDMTGELIIAQSMLRGNERIRSMSDQKLNQNLLQINQITLTLQRTALSMRMVPIRNVFMRMVRLVRDLAKNAGKEIELKVRGEETEIDRNMVEELYEPLVHMFRNAVDHGIEAPKERRRKGKDEKGTIELRAYHRGGNIFIEIEDDGKGLDKEKILRKARSKGLVDKKGDITDAEIHNLIFEPGFSTAKKVTGLSGRGVGLDVVRKAVEKLRGRVEIVSEPGKGSTFITRLPLTLAIIDGMLVRVGEERYIIPVLAILESSVPSDDNYYTVEGKEEMILSRGELIPVIRLDQIFGVKRESANPGDGLVVTVEHDGEKRCLWIDELLRKEEVVIKSLGEKLKHTQGIAGGAIMGDGRVGLILDIPGVIEIAKGNGLAAGRRGKGL